MRSHRSLSVCVGGGAVTTLTVRFQNGQLNTHIISELYPFRIKISPALGFYVVEYSPGGSSVNGSHSGLPLGR